MADWATYVVIPESGGYELYDARFGAVGIDLDLLAGPDVVLPLLRSRSREDARWHDDVWCAAAALFDLRRRTLLFFAWEGPTTELRLRSATWQALQRAWAGWELRWTYDGPAELLGCLGLDPAQVRDRDRTVLADSAVGPDDEEVDEVSPMLRVVTIGDQRCHLLAAVNDHPIAEGPGLLDRLADAADHGVCTVAAGSGMHIDPGRRRIGWWLLDAAARAGEMAAGWPGWEVEFWQDRWHEHVRAAPGRFAPPTVEPVQARAELRENALAHWFPGPDAWPGWMQAALPDHLADAVRRTIDTVTRG